MPNVTIVENDGIVAAGSNTSEEELRAAITPTEKTPAPAKKEQESDGKTADAKTVDKTPERRVAGSSAATGSVDEESGATGSEVRPPRVERRKASIQEEINALTKKREDARREAEEWQRRADDAKRSAPQAPAAQPAPVIGGTPTLGLRPDGTVPPFKEFLKAYGLAHPNADYEDAIDAHAELGRQATLQAFQKQTQEERAKQEYADIVAKHETRWKAAVTANPGLKDQVADADDILAAAGFEKLPAVMYHAVIRSDRSADIIADLVSHPDVMVSLAQMASQQEPTIANANTMRLLLERSLGAGVASGSSPTPPLRHSRTNPPPKLVGSSPNASDASQDEPSYEDLKSRLYPKRR